MLFATTSSFVPSHVRLKPTWINGSYTHIHTCEWGVPPNQHLQAASQWLFGASGQRRQHRKIYFCRSDGFRRQQLVKMDAVIVVAQPKEIATKRAAACACNFAFNKHRHASQIMNSAITSLPACHVATEGHEPQRIERTFFKLWWLGWKFASFNA